MTETTWTHTLTGTARRSPGGRILRLWADHVVAAVHRTLDRALHADDLRALNGATLSDIGLHRE